MTNKVEKTPWNDNKGEQFETAMGYGGKNQSFYRKDRDGKEYCWMAVDANTGTVDIRDDKGDSLFVIDAERKKVYLQENMLVRDKDISDMLTRSDADRNFATKQDISDMLTKTIAKQQ